MAHRAQEARVAPGTPVPRAAGSGRRLFILLREQGEPSGINRIYRLNREEGLTVRKRKTRRRVIGTRTPILVETKLNARLVA